MSEELNCSDGAKMLIERMKTNPEEFRGSGARWAAAMNQMLQVRRGGVETNVMMSRRDMNALFDAFEKHVMETALAEYTIEELMSPRLERKKVQVRRGAQPLTASQITDEALKILEAEYTKAFETGNIAHAEKLKTEYMYEYDRARAEYRNMRYNTKDRYDTGWKDFT